MVFLPLNEQSQGRAATWMTGLGPAEKAKLSLSYSHEGSSVAPGCPALSWARWAGSVREHALPASVHVRHSLVVPYTGIWRHPAACQALAVFSPSVVQQTVAALGRGASAPHWLSLQPVHSFPFSAHRQS